VTSTCINAAVEHSCWYCNKFTDILNCYSMCVLEGGCCNTWHLQHRWWVIWWSWGWWHQWVRRRGVTSRTFQTWNQDCFKLSICQW